MAEFTPFPVPIDRGDTPLVQHAGIDYICTGCGAHIPDGVWIFEKVVDGMIVGMKMTSGPDTEVFHRCGDTIRADGYPMGDVSGDA